MKFPSLRSKLLTLLSIIIIALAFCIQTNPSAAEAKSKTIKYTVSLKSGSYEGAQTVKITSEISKLKIYYTTDGSKPNSKSAKYSSKGIKISESCTLRLLIKKTGYTSISKSIKYTIKPAKKEIDFEKLNNFKDKPLYQLLNDDEKKVYEALFNCCLNYDDIVAGLEKYNLKYSQLLRIYHYMISENPQLFYVNDVEFDYGDNADELIAEIMNSSPKSDNYVIKPVISSVLPKYTNTKAEVKSITKKLQSSASSIINKANKKYTDTFDIIKFYHDEIDKMTTYDADDLYGRTTAGTDDILVFGRGLCSAYARAFSYLCQLSDIPCINIEGDATTSDGRTEGHAWNKVKLDNEWYNIDSCWDDKDYRCYIYFCLTDKALGYNHTPDPMYDLAELKADAEKYNYFKYNGYTEIMNSYDAKRELFQNLAKAIREADESKSGDYIYGFVYYYPSSPIRTSLRTELSGDVWSYLRSIDSEAYSKLYKLYDDASWLVGYSSASFVIKIK
ncbi:MAG: chitobiase/beta-hexosaminidase C-terminal domain-containing protein [Lachnospiraceae bacterium]|nr:chitobiase/beta-hexosaminidase C-terminal domain-containing protein [Lachnospiraceae bacterium]